MNYTLLVAAHRGTTATRKMDAAAEQQYYEAAASQVRALEQIAVGFSACFRMLSQFASLIGVFAAHVPLAFHRRTVKAIRS